MTVRGLPAVAAALALASCAAQPPGSAPEPEARAVRFLAREVPAWPAKNKCFSCHNNGDAARALIEARRRALPFDPSALDATTAWLRRPSDWKDNGPPGDFSDKNLPILQFAHALAAAVEAGEAGSKGALQDAARQVAGLQQPDGSWAVDADGLPGSPVTYGRTLATVVARRVFLAADPARHAGPIARAEAWLRLKKPAGPLEAGALLMSSVADPAPCLEWIRKGRSSDGGWGPYATSPPEAFDTAIVLLGLSSLPDRHGVGDLISAGRSFLLNGQQQDGSWPETTRPPGSESYAQRISTTGWATLALLATAPARTSE